MPSLTEYHTLTNRYGADPCRRITRRITDRRQLTVGVDTPLCCPVSGLERCGGRLYIRAMTSFRFAANSSSVNRPSSCRLASLRSMAATSSCWRSDRGSHEIELNGLGLSVPYRGVAIKRGFAVFPIGEDDERSSLGLGCQPGQSRRPKDGRGPGSMPARRPSAGPRRRRVRRVAGLPALVSSSFWRLSAGRLPV
jgi:hypothetical protein